MFLSFFLFLQDYKPINSLKIFAKKFKYSFFNKILRKNGNMQKFYLNGNTTGFHPQILIIILP